MVYFIGAGPGAADLITLRGKAILERAEVILWADTLVNPEILNLARPAARIYPTGGMALEKQVEVMVEAVKSGQVVARLHTGDPSIYGATREQMRALDTAGVAYAVVPGVSSVFAVAAALKTELTQPEVSQTVILTRAAGRTPVPPSEALKGLAAHRATLVLLLSANLLEGAVAELLAGGYSPDTPAALVYRASWPEEKILRTPLSEISKAAKEANINRQAILIVGEALAAGATRSRLYSTRLQPGCFVGDER